MRISAPIVLVLGVFVVSSADALPSLVLCPAIKTVLPLGTHSGAHDPTEERKQVIQVHQQADLWQFIQERKTHGRKRGQKVETHQYTWYPPTPIPMPSQTIIIADAVPGAMDLVPLNKRAFQSDLLFQDQQAKLDGTPEPETLPPAPRHDTESQTDDQEPLYASILDVECRAMRQGQISILPAVRSTHVIEYTHLGITVKWLSACVDVHGGNVSADSVACSVKMSDGSHDVLVQVVKSPSKQAYANQAEETKVSKPSGDMTKDVSQERASTKQKTSESGSGVLDLPFLYTASDRLFWYSFRTGQATLFAVQASWLQTILKAEVWDEFAGLMDSYVLPWLSLFPRNNAFWLTKQDEEGIVVPGVDPEEHALHASIVLYTTPLPLDFSQFLDLTVLALLLILLLVTRYARRQ